MFTVILPTAGRSSRFQAAAKKPFVSLAGKPVWSHSAELFAARADVRQLIVVLAPEDRSFFETEFHAILARLRSLNRSCSSYNSRRPLRVDLVDGGRERVDSVRNALKAVDPESGMIAVHDAARPCVRSGSIDAVFREALVHGAALLAAPIVGTVKRSTTDGLVESTVSRERLWEAQTPQVFRREWLVEAYERTFDVPPTDDCRLIEAIGRPIRIVTSDHTNIKLTTAEDLRLAEMFLALCEKE